MNAAEFVERVNAMGAEKEDEAGLKERIARLEERLAAVESRLSLLDGDLR